MVAVQRRPDRCQRGRVAEWHRDGITDPFAELLACRCSAGRVVEVVRVGKSLDAGRLKRCQSSALGWVNEAASSRCHEAGRDSRRRVGWSQPPVNRHVGGATLVALRPLRKRKVIGLVLEEPVDASQIFLTEFGLPQHVVSRRQA